MVQRFFLSAFALVTMATMLAAPAQAQSNDPRIVGLEEQIRQLNGRIEELNFQMLQMQDQIRRMQEDNEFRLQQLEDQQQGSLQPTVAPSSDVATAPVQGAAPKTDRPSSVEEQIISDLESQTLAPAGGNLGSMQVDGNGNVIDTEIDFSNQGVGAAIDTMPVNSVTLTGSPEQIYETGYRHVLNGDYGLAEAVFASFVATYPDDALAADAKFWLGESMLAQGRFEDAAEVFIDARAQHPNAVKAPETMYKIGSIMADLGNRDVACATFADALNIYGNMAVKTRSAINAGQQKARC